MTSNEQSLNYKVVNLVKSYKFRVKFMSIRVHTKKSYDFLTLTAMDHGGGSLVFLNFETIVYFFKINKK
jgi:hypothetical protein